MARCWPHNLARLLAPEHPVTDLRINAVGYDDFTDPSLAPIRHLRSYNCYTLHFVLNGKGTLFVNGVTHTVEKDALFFTPYRQPMAYYPCDEDPWEYIFINFSGEQADALCSHMGLTPEHPVRRDLPHVAISQTLEQLIRTVQAADTPPYYRVLSTFYELVHLCERRPSPKGAANARSVIDMNYASQDFTVEQLCRDLHVSHSHLCRIFKEAYGTSVVRYLIDRRLQQACRLLRESDLSIKAVAFSCGFSDEMHFMKTFKSSLGMTPSQYRRTH